MHTAEVRVDDFVALQEVGKVVNPILAAGQIEGGVAQGIGLALYENVVWQQGRMVNGQMTNYIMPTSLDVPPILACFFEEIPLRPWTWWRKRHWRASARWNRARDCQRNRQRDRRQYSPHSGHAGSATRTAGNSSCLNPRTKFGCSAA